METLLLIGYVTLLVTMLVIMEYNIRRHGKWWPLWIFELISAIGAFGIMMIADTAPGTGMMPGLDNFGIVIYSMGATAAYFALLILSLIIGSIRRNHQDK